MSVVFKPGEKGHRDENFPVASYVISKKHRGAVLAFYRFARAADDVADHPNLSEAEKIAQLDQFEVTLLGKNDDIAEALPLRAAIAERGLSPRHAQDLLIAFRQDASKSRYKDWGELMEYCRYSAAPVGRFVLDVHGENSSTWPASDGLCAALQVINHLQDCKADYQRLKRVYIPQETFSLYKVDESVLAQARASQAFRACLTELTGKTQRLLASVPLSAQVKDGRLALEVLTIEKLADKLLEVLLMRDPLSERVHLSKLQSFFILAHAALQHCERRCFSKEKI